ncbi:MAG: hypothetical protein HeimC3_36800 [Candidatus Heimdallarchaeota archaeon LC_3]|nr:MAG: hypothetical protein HeimC3_36800 [Candidatus Heimdallarchaeota archaeon LC_3]
MTGEILSDLSGEEIILLLPPSCLRVYYLLSNHQLTFSEISQKINFSDRTIRTALKTLKKLNLVEKFPLLTDMRKSSYIALNSRQ